MLEIKQYIKVEMPTSVAGDPIKLQDAAVAATKAANDAASSASEGTSATIDIVTEAKGDIDVKAGTEAEILSGITAVLCTGSTSDGVRCKTRWAAARQRLRSLAVTPKTQHPLTHYRIAAHKHAHVRTHLPAEHALLTVRNRDL